MPSAPDSPSTFPRLVGRAVERVEDAALLTGRGRFADDVGERPGTAHAAVLRSPHAHAEIVSLDAAAALSMPEVVTVLTGEEVAAWSRPFIAGVKQPMRHYALAVDRVRYTGEPVAVVVARDRYGAEDALERIEVEYRELDPVVDPVAAAAPGAPLLHREVGSNVVSDRRLRYGDPDAAFASAAHQLAISVRYPRNACTPIEGFVVVAEHLGDDGYDVLSNFQGPFTLHPVMVRALGVPGARLRLRSPKDSGGSFGVKQAVFPYVVVMCLASRKARCPVKWVEDRLEHLLAATSATNRVTTLEAAVSGDGTIAALRWDQFDDCGAYLRGKLPLAVHGCGGRPRSSRQRVPHPLESFEVHLGEGDIVEVDAGVQLRDHAPHRVAQNRGALHRGVAREQRLAGRGSEVALNHPALLGGIQLVVRSEAAKVVERTVEAGILPVDQPHPIAVVDEVRGVEIVVAEDDLDRTHHRFEVRGAPEQTVEPSRHPAPAFAQGSGVVAHHLEDPEHGVRAAQVRR